MTAGQTTRVRPARRHGDHHHNHRVERKQHQHKPRQPTPPPTTLRRTSHESIPGRKNFQQALPPPLLVVWIAENNDSHRHSRLEPPKRRHDLLDPRHLSMCHIVRFHQNRHLRITTTRSVLLQQFVSAMNNAKDFPTHFENRFCPRRNWLKRMTRRPHQPQRLAHARHGSSCAHQTPPLALCDSPPGKR